MASPAITPSKPNSNSFTTNGILKPTKIAHALSITVTQLSESFNTQLMTSKNSSKMRSAISQSCLMSIFTQNVSLLSAKSPKN